MRTLTIELEYAQDSVSVEAVENQLKKKLEGSDFKVISLSEGSHYTDSSYDKMHSSSPGQPQEVEPDVNSTGAGGMVSPDSSGYPNKK
jgi:hypothetical protein